MDSAHGHKMVPIPMSVGNTVFGKVPTQSTCDSPLLVTQYWATLVRSRDVDQHTSACSDESCVGRSSDVGGGGSVPTTMPRMSPIVTFSAWKNERWSLGANCMQRCSELNTVDGSTVEVGSDSLTSTIDEVVPARG